MARVSGLIPLLLGLLACPRPPNLPEPPVGGPLSSSGGAMSSSQGPPAIGLQTRPSNTTCVVPARPLTNGNVRLERVFPALSFDQPIFLLQAPGTPGFFFVVERGGAVMKFANNDAVEVATAFIRLNVNAGPGEAGLLGMAFHPNWQQNHLAFLSYTDDEGSTGLRTVISRFRSDDGGATLNPASEETVFTLEQPYDNHNGGGIAFGPDGFLYIGLGDGGSGGDPLNAGQDLETLLGKMLRVDVDQGPTYGIPSSNPFTGANQKREIFAYGLRNPWRFSFDRELGTLWVGDVGQDRWEEIDVVTRGGNYGWRLREGAHCYNPGNNCPTVDLIEPVYEYPHSEGRSVTGGYVYRGSQIPALYGTYVYADFETGIIYGGYVDGPTPEPSRELAFGSSVSSFGEDLQGELYVVNLSQGSIHKIRAGTGMVNDTFPALLSQTGCVDSTDPTQMAPGVIPYDVADPFWSDGAVKTRFMALPNTTTIGLDADGDFEFPIGTVLIKSFRLAGRLIETRLFMRHEDGEWGGYTYEWNTAQTDATLLTAQKDVDIGPQRWTYPSRAQCLQCHSAAAGRSLGLELLQLNSEFTYPTGITANQLRTLNHIGLFTTPLTTQPELMERLSPPQSASSLQDRARSYLHTNCAYCHRPNGGGRGDSNLLYWTADADLGICNEAPDEGDLGIAGARLLVPGNPALSLLHVRMNRRGVAQMPPLATSQVDPLGAALVDEWISTMGGCP